MEEKKENENEKYVINEKQWQMYDVFQSLFCYSNKFVFLVCSLLKIWRIYFPMQIY